MPNIQPRRRLQSVVVLILLSVLLTGCGMTRVRFYGASMEPNLREGDFLLFRRIAPSDLKRGEVILFEWSQHELVSRVIGLPGESVEIRSGQVLMKLSKAG